MIICWNSKVEALNFAVNRLIRVLEEKKERVDKVSLLDQPINRNVFCIKIDYLHRGNFSDRRAIFPRESINIEEKYDIKVTNSGIEVFGYDRIGAMYGVLDLAETIEYYGIDKVENKTCKADLKNRGVKFNLPIEPYDRGEPFDKNYEACLTKEFWKDYIEMLAVNRYNLLSLWTNNPFYYMFRLDKYPDATPYTDVELSNFKELFQFIFGYAKELGIKTYIITWNIRITPCIAKAIGLPEDIGDQEKRYDLVYQMFNGIDNASEHLDIVRQKQQKIKDYFVECIKTLLMTYGDLYGIGTSYSEEMAGSAQDRQDWVEDVYLKGMQESGREVPFVIRTNAGSAKVSEKMYNRLPHKENYLSWKYSIAHMYSDTHPQFEDMQKTWGELDMEKTKVIYTVRNDDVYTFRYGNYDFVKEYLKGMIDKPYAEGFYWGADGYMWGIDFQHSEGGHKSWKYDFEKHWHQFELLGRLAYDNTTPKELWELKYQKRHGEIGKTFHRALECAAQIVPAVNRLIWYQFDFEWHPESLLSVWGFRTILDFMESKPMPGIGTASIAQYAAGNDEILKAAKETVADTLYILRKNMKELRERIGGIDEHTLFGENECVYWDLLAWLELGEYYICKIEAAVLLCQYKASGDIDKKATAIALLEQGLEHWQELTLVWSRHYIPYKLPRIKFLFGYGLYYKDVKRDIEIAKSLEV